MTTASWFCIQTQSKREHIAASWLRRLLNIEVYVPRIKFARAEPRGLVWTTDALFPNYLFARFDLARLVHQVDCSPGVRRIVRFGNHCPAVPESVIETLRAYTGPGEVHVLDQQLEPGEPVQLAGGCLHGLEAVVTRVLPTRQRICVLLQFLNRQTMVEVEINAVVPRRNPRLRLLQRT